MDDDLDRELYDRAANRHPTVLWVDLDALDLAGRLFGEDPDGVGGYWADNVFVPWERERR